MSNQLLIYKHVVSISKEQHRDWSLKMDNKYFFTEQVNSFPLLSAEFAQSASIYPIVFVGTEETLMPAAIVGLQEQKNLFINEAGEWQADYIPAFIRRYPFVFSSGDDGKTFTLCIDEKFSGWNQTGSGERLFDSDGNQTQYLNNVINFLQIYQAQFRVTEAFCQQIKELDLLEPMQAQFTTNEGKKSSLSGFWGISRDKLNKLSQEQVFGLMQTGWLELIYLHLHSLNLFSQLAKKGTKVSNSEAE
ncbi:SapC [Nostoc sp. PCC 7524]|uniref:SapC family protein n=1 Tax=Nostoc sp. (strain ATCC 29411 / PCC 7524) TaxID=28072 RepID=UPI00029F00D6|nr:SapC family protein [Nostoc sp. PCC 7524]AFY47168.1 SapC [Nostoc sp. PCC 7524]